MTVDDCVSIDKNDNPRYPDADVFFFVKTVDLESYGETETVTLYIKDYIIEADRMEQVIVISFHREGMHDL